MGAPAPSSNDAHLLCTAILTRSMLGSQSLIVFLRDVVCAMVVIVVHPVLAMEGKRNGREVQ